MRLNVGSGHDPRPGFLNCDLRPVAGVDLLADAGRLPFAAGTFSEVRAESLLEHFDDPRPVIAELARVLTPQGRLVVRVPALGTCAAHLDPTHRFLADLTLWRELLLQRFATVRLGSVGVKYRSHPLLVAAQRALIAALRFHDLGQCWILTARRPRLQIHEEISCDLWWTRRGIRTDAQKSEDGRTIG